MDTLKRPSARLELLENVMAGLTVSFVAVSLGAAFGLLSGRDAFAGMLSAAVIPIITSALGGTRVQCSGPTGPMTAVTAVIVAFAHKELAASMPGVAADHFIFTTMVLAGVLLCLMAALRLGRFISAIPKPVISGFMSGISLIIWYDVAKKLFGLAGKEALKGDLVANLGVFVATAAMIFVVPMITRRVVPRFASLLSGTLVSILVMTVIAAALSLNIERLELASGIKSFGDVAARVAAQIPSSMTFDLLVIAAPFAAQLALLGYLDTLMTAVVIDKLRGEPSQQNRELAAQGLATVTVAALGGIAGAQATIRSVLIVKEGATMRLAGVLVGVFALVELLMFQDLLNMIPQAVFCGVLVKVGWDVFDREPFQLYVRTVKDRVRAGEPRVGPVELAFVVGTALVTVLVNLNVAVIGATILYYVVKKVRPALLEAPAAPAAPPATPAPTVVQETERNRAAE